MAIYPLTFVAADPIHHGAGVAGNTSLLRTQDIVLPDGSPARVPFVSGNSLRHQLREAATLHALAAMGIEHHSLPKLVVDLLWSGGALTKTGSTSNLELQRAVADLYPPLTLFGYSAGSDMVMGQLRVNNLHLVCRENQWRMPDQLRAEPNADMPAAAFRSDEFGTRHDPMTSAGQWVAESDVEPATNQMIYDAQTIKPGAILYTTLTTLDPTTAELDALAAALQTLAPEGVVYLGAKSAAGYGRTGLSAPAELLARDVAHYTERLAGMRDQIVQVWTDLVS